MSKIKLDSIQGGFNLDKINSNFKKLEDALNLKVLYRDNPYGEPNVMLKPLDMNGFPILNAPNIGGGAGGGASDAAHVTFAPTGSIESGNVQDAIVEVASDIPVGAINFPKPNGLVAEIGSSTRYAREDHVHVGGSGGGGSGGSAISNGQVYAYQRSITAPTGTPGSVVYDFATASIITPTGDSLENGWTKKIPAGTAPLYVTVASASSLESSDSIAANEWSTPVVMAANGANGTNGLSVATVYLYKRTATNVAPPLPVEAITWQFTPPQASGGFNGWSQFVPDSLGGPNLWVTTATAVSNTSTDVINPTEWAAPQILTKDGSNGGQGPAGNDGTRGTVNIAAGGFSSWSDAGAVSAILNAGFGNPRNRDMVTLYGSGFSQTRFYDNGSWIALTAYLNGNMLVTGTVAASAVSAGTFTGQTYRTNSSGARIVINEGSNNRLQAYNADNLLIAEIGSGTTTGGYLSIQGSTLYPIGYFRQSSTLGAGPGLFVSTAATNNIAPAISASKDSPQGAPVLTVTVPDTGIGIQCAGKFTIPAKSADYGIAYMNTVIPVLNNTYTLGASGASWSGIYSSTAVNVTSDERLKKDIKDSDLGLSFVMNLRPVSYRLKEAQKKVVSKNNVNPLFEEEEFTTESIPGTRLHYGLIAQEVKSALGEIDTGIWCLSDEADATSTQSLRYEELIGPMIKAIQELKRQLDEVKRA